ncbi:MAG: hypothetical protein QM702_03390 [Rubrivivax sp.]
MPPPLSDRPAGSSMPLRLASVPPAMVVVCPSRAAPALSKFTCEEPTLIAPSNSVNPSAAPAWPSVSPLPDGVMPAAVPPLTRATIVPVPDS